MKTLMAWDRPGNVRELENFVERAVILTRGKTLDAPLAELRKTSEVKPTPRGVTHEIGRPTSTAAVTSPIDKHSIADQYANRQREEILSALTACRGRVGGADGTAARLGVNRTTLFSRMKKFDIYAMQFS